MIINVPYEAYTMTLGFFLNNRIWDLMLMTGVAYIPILIMVVKSIADAYQGGDDEGDRGSMALRYIEVGTIKIILVMVFVMMPLGRDIDVQSVTYNDFTCAGEESTEKTFLKSLDLPIKMEQTVDDDGAIIDASAINNSISMGIGGITVNPPLIFDFFQNYSTKATNAIASTMPCITDVTSIGLAIGNVKMKHNDTQEYFSTFVEQCYSPLLSSAIRGNDRMTQEDIQDYYWIGSGYFVGGTLGATSGLTDAVYNDRRMSMTDSYFSKSLSRIYDSTVPTRFDPVYWYDFDNDGMANPTCADGYKLLEEYVSVDFENEIEELDSDDIDRGWTVLTNIYGSYFHGDVDEPNQGLTIIMKRLTEATMNNESSSFYTDDENMDDDTFLFIDSFDQLQSYFKGAGAVAGAFSSMMDSVFAKMLANPTIAIVQCLVFTVSPIIILMSNYSLKIIGGVVITVFGLEFTYVIFEICDWLEGSMLEMLSSQYSIVSMEAQATKFAVYNAVYYSYFILPMVWFGMLGTVGFMAGSMGQSMNQSAKQTGSTAKAAAGKVTSGATGGKDKK